ncbi:trypsin-like peptidase domain-containing protein [Candidatus Poriferisocius sp.]|uniref:trypsin-like peptidase domain-containing protein n=1 Tax=Candidatus Poriferisocius sp. TaxID=3101276 RepID=UPI003B014735
MALRLAVAISVFIAVLSIAETASAQFVSRAEITQRDQLIANQEALLNTYRCQFDVDTDVVPGGCVDGSPAQPPAEPQPFTGTPNFAELARRDQLIANQEALLNTYRCQFNIDTSIVPGGCSGGPIPDQPARPTPPADGVELSPAEVYALVSPSIALIETSSKLGSGFLIEGGYIVTNHHVVWPDDKAWVVFPDGTELRDVPVLGSDFMADLAVLGPVDVPFQPLRVAADDDLPLGSDLFLVGYPSEPELFPQPTITQGILSRLRQWTTYNLTVLQSDAAIARGQSGGALLNSQGVVVGISTWRFSEAGFSLSTSAADDALIVERLINSYTPPEEGTDRRAPRKFGDFEHKVRGTQGVDSPAFTFNAAAGTKVTIQISGRSDGAIIVSDPVKTLASQNGNTTGAEETTFEVLRSGKHFVRILSRSDGEFSFDLTSTIRLHPYTDEFDGTTLLAEGDSEVFYGLFDYPFDSDWFKISLEEGEVIEINTDSVLADTTITVRNRETGETVMSDDTNPRTGLGFSVNAQLRFTAPEAGDYAIHVDERTGQRGNGYALTVERVQQ